MSIILYLVLCFGYISAWRKGEYEKYGPVGWALALPSCDQSKYHSLDVSSINVHFYDFRNGVEKDFPVGKAAKGILSLRNLDKKKKFFIFVGGFKSHINKNTEQKVRDTFRNFRNSYLIIIDHSAYTYSEKAQFKQLKSYERSVKYVYYIGKDLAQMLTDLYKGGISAKNIHCIGHSLGSQILGHVGENFIEATGKKIARITALDPARPCYDSEEEHIRSGVAEYVEVYHCNSGVLGTSKLLADVDFFVNDGKAQPNCGTPYIPLVRDSLSAAKCSHKTCVTIWMASVAHKDWFPAYKCDKYEQLKNKNCKEMTTAGFWNPGKAKGRFFFSTKGYNFS